MKSILSCFSRSREVFESKVPEVKESVNFNGAKLSKIYLKAKDSLNVEPGALLAAKNVEMKTGFNGSMLEVFMRYFLGGESLFLNNFALEEGKNEGWIALEESVPGQVASYQLKKGEVFTLGRTAYVASDTNAKLETCFNGVMGWWKGIGISNIKVTLNEGERGRVFFSSTSGIVKKQEVKEGSAILVDNSNIVAYSDGVKITNMFLGGVNSFIFSGEGALNKVEGNGVIFLGSGEAPGKKYYASQ